MMRGPSYDDSYISRKMASMPGPTFVSPGPGAYGRPPMGTYMQDTYSNSPYSSYSASTVIRPDSTEVMEERRSMSPPPVTAYRPSAATQIILNRVALGRSTLPPLPRGYPPMGPPPRMMPRLPPSYYDYDYGYGGYGGYYSYVPPPPPMPPSRMSRYNAYLDDDLESSYVPRYRPRAVDIDDAEVRDKMLQDHVDKMRIRLKSLAYSLDPTGPVPEIIVPERTTKKSASSDDKKYSSAVAFNELPKLASRRQRYYPEDDRMKDNLRIKCLSHYKTTRTAAGYQKARLFDATTDVLPDSSSRLTKFSASKWEEPDTVFGAPSDRKPFSKAITDGTTEEPSEEKKERRKKKKSKERELTEAAVEESAVTAAAEPTSEVTPSLSEAALDGDGEELDEKERKKLEKKKRKAEREAAAKAAMEAELAALAAAEAELARLEAESTPATDAAAPEPAAPAEAPAEPAAEVKRTAESPEEPAAATPAPEAGQEEDPAGPTTTGATSPPPPPSADTTTALDVAADDAADAPTTETAPPPPPTRSEEDSALEE